VATRVKGTRIIHTFRSFKEICEDKADDLPELTFLYVGSIDEVREKVM
jgi:F-type H+/Na+-transporting ATPase subunit beta